MNASKRIATCLLLFVAAGAQATPAPVEDTRMVFNVQNDTQYNVHLKLYSQSRDRHWPSHGRAFALATGGQAKKVEIACEKQETVCYGAWVQRGRYAISTGAGTRGIQPCPACCFVCGETAVQNVQLKMNVRGGVDRE